ncbi:MAG: arginase family protein [Promethearchaeota archaeon]
MEFQKSQYGSFGGLAKAGLSLKDADLLLVGIPYESATSGKKGTSQSPSILRLLSKDLQTMTRRNISLENMKILDVGDILTHSTNDLQNNQQITTSMTYLFTQSSAPVLAIGGDHSITFPELSALKNQGTLGIVWIDAHRDLLNKLDRSKYSHGCSLRRLIDSKNVLPENVLLIGTRFFTPSESDFVKKNNISEISMTVLEDAANPRSLIREAILKLASQVDLMSLSLDIDVVDPSAAPGTGTPVAGGMGSNLLLNIIGDFPIPLRSVDIVEVSPPLDTFARITTKLQMAIITELIGKFKNWKEIENIE